MPADYPTLGHQTAVEIVLMQAGYRARFVLSVNGSRAGFATIDRAISRLYEILLPDGDAPARVSLIDPTCRQRIYTDTTRAGIDWLKAMVVATQIVGWEIEPSRRDVSRYAPKTPNMLPGRTLFCRSELPRP